MIQNNDYIIFFLSGTVVADRLQKIFSRQEVSASYLKRMGLFYSQKSPVSKQVTNDIMARCSKQCGSTKFFCPFLLATT